MFPSFLDALAAVRTAISRVIVGQPEVIDGVLTGLLAGGHVLLESVPGLGKTLLIKTVGDVLACTFSRIQFTPDLTPKDILGTPKIHGPIFTNLLLADEINRAQPKTQAALLEAMQERRVTLAGVTHPLPKPFLVFATQNPVEQEGTFPLPEAQLDRFMLKFHVPFPTEDELLEIAARTTQGQAVTLEPCLTAEQVAQMQAEIHAMPVSEVVQRYAVRLVLATHPDYLAAPRDVKRTVLYGASPRGVQALILAAKVHALLRGESMVTPEAVAGVAIPALQHRILLSYEGQATGIITADLVKILLDDIPFSGFSEGDSNGTGL